MSGSYRIERFYDEASSRDLYFSAPLQFLPGASRNSLGLTGAEAYDVRGLGANLTPGQKVTVRVRRDDGGERTFEATVRIDSPIEVEYYRHGGVLQYVLRQLLH